MLEDEMKMEELLAVGRERMALLRQVHAETNLVARLGGFHEKQMSIHEANITVNVQAMSDAEINLRLEQLQKELFSENVIDGELVVVESGAGPGGDNSDPQSQNL